MNPFTAYRRQRSVRRTRRPTGRPLRLECLEDRNLLTAGFRAIQFGLPTDTPVPADYDGDGKADVAVFRPSVGDWFVQRSGTNTFFSVHWGQQGDVPVPADYDGDGKADFAVARNNPDATKTWWILRSSDNTPSAQSWGTSSTAPAPADYDGDGKADIAVFSAKTGNSWSILQSSDGQTRTLSVNLRGGPVTVPADFDGDGRADVAEINTGKRTWSIRQSSDGQIRTQAGAPVSDRPVPADYDGDRKADLATYRAIDGTWTILLSSNGQTRTQTLGASTDLPVPADYDGDRRADVTVFSTRDATWSQRLSSGIPFAPTYSFDGTGNNLAHPEWGSTFEDQLRTAPAGYADGVSAPAGPFRPSARLVSTTIATDTSNGNTPNDRFLSAIVSAWGQFIDHDLDLTPGGDRAQAFPITVPPGDPVFDPGRTGTQVLPFTRSRFDPKTGTKTGNPRQQVNALTAWLDGSAVYGTSPERADALRAHVGGRLRTSPGDLLPLNASGTGFLAGDDRVDENIGLTAVQTLMLREHNFQAGRIAREHPELDDEAIYQRARSIVISEIQRITFDEFLPALLGNGAIAVYRGYNPEVNPGIANEFSTAAYRFGHSMLNNRIGFLNPDGSERFSVSLREAFLNPQLILENGVDPILKGLATVNSQEVDNKIVDGLQNFLFAQPNQPGFDLAALNIQRGRDHGLADYNTTRVAYGLPRVTSFAQISSNPAVQAALQSLYGSVDNVDLWVGGLAEDHVPGGSVGPLFQRIIAIQFQSLRDGDRHWYERSFSGPDLDALKNTTLAQIIARNTVNTDLQDNVFFFRIEVSGTIFDDANRNGVRDASEAGLAGQTVQLVDASSGALIATTTTASDGTYRFDQRAVGLKPGVAYRVRQVVPAGSAQTTADPPAVRFTRGQAVSGLDFGNGFGVFKRPPNRTKSSVLTQSSISVSPDLLAAVLPEVNPLESQRRIEPNPA